MVAFIKGFYLLLIKIGVFFQSFLLLALRLFWGWEFLNTGLNKLKNIDPIIVFFQSLAIPMPAFNAYFAASVEMIGGGCLLIGFASRLVSIPLATVMIVAYFTAHYDALMSIYEDPQGVISLLPFNFLLTTIIVFAFGPGLFSVDAIIKYFLGYPKERSRVDQA